MIPREGHTVTGNIQSRTQVQCFRLRKDILQVFGTREECSLGYGAFAVTVKEASTSVLGNDNTHFSLHSKTRHKAVYFFPTETLLEVSLLIKDSASD